MRIAKTFRGFTATLISLALAGGGVTKADLWNLSADWSDAANPNGVWSYYVSGALGVSGTRGSDNFANPPGPPYIWGIDVGFPYYFGWSKSNGSEVPTNNWDLQIGDIYGHTWPQSWGSLEIRWTSPLTGPIDVSGGVWAIRAIGRSNYWQLTLNGSVLSDGYVYSGDVFSRSNPAPIDLNLNVNVGDILAFSAWADNIHGDGVPDYIALDLSINPVPLPGAVLLGAIGLGFAGWRLRRRTP